MIWENWATGELRDITKAPKPVSAEPGLNPGVGSAKLCCRV